MARTKTTSGLDRVRRESLQMAVSIAKTVTISKQTELGPGGPSKSLPDSANQC